MKCSGQQLFTPLYLKLNDAMPWPEQEKAFYLLSSEGLFLCRNTPFFRSCVPAREFPGELAAQRPFLQLAYPRIPRPLLEQVVGFFDLIGDRFGSEAAVLLAWNRTTETVEVVVPPQTGLVGMSWAGNPYPLELDYEVPPLPPHLVLLGDIHSHVDGSAYASFVDKADEVHQPGLHLVVGRILDEPPQFHCEATTDGCRFRVRDLSLVLEGYHQRRTNEVPADWLSKVTVEPWTGYRPYETNLDTGSSCGTGAGSSKGTGGCLLPAPPQDPEATALKPLAKHQESPRSPAFLTPSSNPPPAGGNSHRTAPASGDSDQSAAQ